MDSQLEIFCGKKNGTQDNSIGRRFGLVVWTWKPSGSRLGAPEALAVGWKEWGEGGKD